MRNFGHRPPSTRETSAKTHRPSATKCTGNFGQDTSAIGHQAHEKLRPRHIGHRPPSTRETSAIGHQAHGELCPRHIGHRSPSTRETLAKTHRPSVTKHTENFGQDTSAIGHQAHGKLRPRHIVHRPPSTRETRCAMVVPRCVVTPPKKKTRGRGRTCTFITAKAHILEFVEKHEKPSMWRVLETTSDSSSSTQTRPGLGWQPPKVGCARAPSCGGGVTTHLAHAHPASASSCGGGGGMAHLARVHVHTPPRPRVVRGRARRGVPSPRCAMVVSCAPRCAMVEVCQVRGVPRSCHARRGVPWSRCAMADVCRVDEVCRGRGVPPSGGVS